jgi:hypothetical protein
MALALWRLMELEERRGQMGAGDRVASTSSLASRGQGFPGFSEPKSSHVASRFGTDL